VVATLTPPQMSELVSKMKDQGVLYDGLRVLGGGSILGGLILGAIAVFIIDRNFIKASGFALAGSVLTFFGFMHGEQIGIGQTPTVAVSYLVIAGIFAACAKLATVTESPAERVQEHHGERIPAEA
jgi:AGZA family xanthine/uracil permease-like MFS transporter